MGLPVAEDDSDNWEWISLDGDKEKHTETVLPKGHTKIYVDYDSYFWPMPHEYSDPIGSGIREGIRKFAYVWPWKDGKQGTYVMPDGTPTNFSRYTIDLGTMMHVNSDTQTKRKIKVVLNGVEPTSLLPIGGSIRFQAHYGSCWWTIPLQMLKVSNDDFIAGTACFPYNYKDGTRYVVDIKDKTEKDIESGVSRELRVCYVMASPSWKWTHRP